MAASKLKGPAVALALALFSGVLVLGQDPLVHVPAAPGPHPLQALGRPVATATAERPGFDVLVWRRDLTTLSSAEFRGARPGTDVMLQGKADAMEALPAIDPDSSPSSIVLSLAADRGLTLGLDGAATGLVAGVPVRVSAAFYQSQSVDSALVRVPGGRSPGQHVHRRHLTWNECSGARRAPAGGRRPAAQQPAAASEAELHIALQGVFPPRS